MKKIIWFIGLIGWANTVPAALGEAAPLPRATPEAEGVSSAGVLSFVQAIDGGPHEFHSFMLVRHGSVIAEGWWNPYRADLKHTLYSVSKSFVSTAVGLLVDDEKLTVNDKVISFFPDHPPIGEENHLADLTIKNLLTMSVGQDPEPTYRIWETTNWETGFLETPVNREPGSRFQYSSISSYMLSTIVTKITGKTVLEILRQRIFEPLGITDVDWETSPTGNNTGGWGLRLRAEDLAKFGQLYLQHGVWNGRQLLSAKWIAEATSAQILQAPLAPADRRAQSDWLQGYGYQFWRCRHNGFRADGAMGQFIVVLPDQDAVIVITSETKDTQGMLNLIWDHLLPAMHDSPLPSNAMDQLALQQALKRLALPVPSRGVASSLADSISGKTFSIAANDHHLTDIRFQLQGDRLEATFSYDRGTYSIPMGAGAWVYSQTTRLGPNLVYKAQNHFHGMPPAQVAAAYGWKDDRTLELTLRYIESPHTERILARFDGDNVALTFLSPHPRQPTYELTGHAE